MSSGLGLDPRFVLLNPIQEMITDKDTGMPLSGGIVTFYEQNSQTVLKPVYTLSGNGPFSDASYIELPNPMILSAIGTFVDDNGNDIVPYLFPYDGTPTTTTNTVDLYYITVYSAAGVFQFARQGWPNITGNSPTPPVTINSFDNFIPNGQFLLHNNVPSWMGNNFIVNQLPAPTTQLNVQVPAQGGSAADVTPIAQGGWTFQVPHDTGSGSKNSISYTLNPISSNPDVTADPRFLINVSTTVPVPSETFKDLCITFNDVNKFSTNTTQPNYTFSFQGNVTGGSGPVTVQIRTLKWFGTGGSPTTPTDTPFGGGSVVINANQVYNVQGNFGTNAGDIVGSNNDDYVQVVIRFPSNQIFNVQLSDFVLTAGNLVLSAFPQTTNAQFIAPSTAGLLPTPNPDGSSMYLPIKLGPEGFVYDTAEIGNIVAKTNVATFTNSISTVSNELLCDGAQYKKTEYSSLGIPYSRLANAIYDSTSGAYRWGSGVNWVNTYISTGLNTQLIIITNKALSVGAPSDSAGATATGFTFNLNGNPGVSPVTFNYKAYSNASHIATAISTFSTGTHLALSFADFNTGMTFANIGNPLSTISYYASQITASAASALANGSSSGKYFTFSNESIDYYFWFFVTDEKDPGPPGKVGIECKLTATMSAADVAAVIASRLSSFQENPITVTGQPTGGAGSYWTFNPNGVPTAVWYQINGAGNAPGGFGANNVMVALTGAETAAQVASKTQIAMNQSYFSTPNLQNMFLRGTGAAASSIWGDIDQNTRFALDSMLASTGIGTFELTQVFNHNHNLAGGNAIPDQVISYGGGTTPNLPTLPSTSHGAAVIWNLTGNTTLTGGSESRPGNMYVTWAIKY